MDTLQSGKKIIVKENCKTKEQREQNMKKLEQAIEEIVSENYRGASVQIKYEV